MVDGDGDNAETTRSATTHLIIAVDFQEFPPLTRLETGRRRDVNNGAGTQHSAHTE